MLRHTVWQDALSDDGHCTLGYSKKQNLSTATRSNLTENQTNQPIYHSPRANHYVLVLRDITTNYVTKKKKTHIRSYPIRKKKKPRKIKRHALTAFPERFDLHDRPQVNQ